jgi:hypothetical protein
MASGQQTKQQVRRHMHSHESYSNGQPIGTWAAAQGLQPVFVDVQFDQVVLSDHCA